MIDSGEGGYGGVVNGLSAGYSVQGSHTVAVIIWERELGVGGGHAKSTIGIPSLGSDKDYGYGIAAYNNQRVGVLPGG